MKQVMKILILLPLLSIIANGGGVHSKTPTTTLFGKRRGGILLLHHHRPPLTTSRKLQTGGEEEGSDIHFQQSSSSPSTFSFVSSSSMSARALSLRGGGGESGTGTGTGTGIVVAEGTQNLIVGYVMIFMAFSPYLLQPFFPTLLNKLLFVPIYQDPVQGRLAELGWKTRYATLSFLIVSIIAYGVIMNEDLQPGSMLRQSYMAVALFYLSAILKVRREAGAGWFNMERRLGTQAFHICVLTIMTMSAMATPGSIPDRILNMIIHSPMKFFWKVPKVLLQTVGSWMNIFVGK